MRPLLPVAVVVAITIPVLGSGLPVEFQTQGHCGGEAPAVTYCYFLLHTPDNGHLNGQGDSFIGTIDIYGFAHSSFTASHYRCTREEGRPMLCLWVPEPPIRYYFGSWPWLGDGWVEVEAYASGEGPWQAMFQVLRACLPTC